MENLAPQTLGQRIKECRKESGLTQKELGALVNLSPTTILKYEKDQNEPPLRTVEAIANALGVRPDYLLCLTDLKDTDSNHRSFGDAISDYIDTARSDSVTSQFEALSIICLKYSLVTEAYDSFSALANEMKKKTEISEDESRQLIDKLLMFTMSIEDCKLAISKCAYLSETNKQDSIQILDEFVTSIRNHFPKVANRFIDFIKLIVSKEDGDDND